MRFLRRSRKYCVTEVDVNESVNPITIPYMRYRVVCVVGSTGRAVRACSQENMKVGEEVGDFLGLGLHCITSRNGINRRPKSISNIRATLANISGRSSKQNGMIVFNVFVESIRPDAARENVALRSAYFRGKHRECICQRLRLSTTWLPRPPRRNTVFYKRFVWNVRRGHKSESSCLIYVHHAVNITLLPQETVDDDPGMASWSAVETEMKNHDQAMVNDYAEDVDNLLVFVRHYPYSCMVRSL